MGAGAETHSQTYAGKESKLEISILPLSLETGEAKAKRERKSVGVRGLEDIMRTWPIVSTKQSYMGS